MLVVSLRLVIQANLLTYLLDFNRLTGFVDAPLRSRYARKRSNNQSKERLEMTNAVT
jgi:hypothetical protein